MRYVRGAIEPIRFSSLGAALRADLIEASESLDGLMPAASATVGTAPDGVCLGAQA